MVSDYSKKNDNIYFYGKMQYTDVLKLESECDILLALYDPNIRNHKYAAPNKFYEALLLGKPLIMFENTGVDDVISKNDIGCVVKFDKSELKKALLHLINNKNKWNEIGIKAQKLYEKEYSWDIMEGRLFCLYEELKND
jgi:glycosyltransferase involved in cell wall biosynthesis